MVVRAEIELATTELKCDALRPAGVIAFAAWWRRRSSSITARFRASERKLIAIRNGAGKRDLSVYAPEFPVFGLRRPFPPAGMVAVMDRGWFAIRAFFSDGGLWPPNSNNNLKEFNR